MAVQDESLIYEMKNVPRALSIVSDGIEASASAESGNEPLGR